MMLSLLLALMPVSDQSDARCLLILNTVAASKMDSENVEVEDKAMIAAAAGFFLGKLAAGHDNAAIAALVASTRTALGKSKEADLAEEAKKCLKQMGDVAKTREL